MMPKTAPDPDSLRTESILRREDLTPRAWTGFRVGPESGLSPLELDALRRTGQLEEVRS